MPVVYGKECCQRGWDRRVKRKRDKGAAQDIKEESNIEKSIFNSIHNVKSGHDAGYKSGGQDHSFGTLLQGRIAFKEYAKNCCVKIQTVL